MSKKPDISVVMSVFNGAKYLYESTESILSQEGVILSILLPTMYLPMNSWISFSNMLNNMTEFVLSKREIRKK